MRRRRARRRRGLRLDRSGPWIAVVGLFVVLWCTVSTTLFAPWWGTVVAFLLLVPQVWLVARWARSRPRWCLWVPLGGVVAWLGWALIGAAAWGWEP